MPRLNDKGYLERNVSKDKNNNAQATYRVWYMPKYSSRGTYAEVSLGNVIMPKKYAGKKVVFRMEVLKDDN